MADAGATTAGWRASQADIDAIVGARHGDPFALLGPHRTVSGFVIRAFVPHAETLTALGDHLGRNGAVTLQQRHKAGFFEGFVADESTARPASPPSGPGHYRLRARNAEAVWELLDPYMFAPVLGATDDYLLVEGTHQRLFDRLGANAIRHEGVDGVGFVVWAPHALRVSVVGDFNAWDGRRHQMRKRIDSGLWEIFVPDVMPGIAYKYEIWDAGEVLQPLKADPFGFAAELRPSTASVVAEAHAFHWTDAAYVRARSGSDPQRAPMSIYEVHLGSWRRRDDGGFQSYEEFADTLVPYAVDMGFTHLEFLPISEHPLDASWGYQPIGLFAPTRRFGDPAGFARLVDRAHAAGIGIILDWVPAHFPTDMHGLARFDGTALYEHADPRRGWHPDWNTAIYDFGRRETANFLVANALYWLERFHVDGLRVDAVASMLYLDYSRQPSERLPNAEGGNENREAVAFLQQVNERVRATHPGTTMTAEESTAWPSVCRPVHEGGLGFSFKWNMGWTHDTLDYITREPAHRRWHHDKLTFGLVYAWSESFVLPLSHDEVVHGKGSVLSRVPGDAWQKFATVRAYYGLMWGYPGKKLLFMGQEFGQGIEWNFDQQLEWHLLGQPAHRGLQTWVRDLNRVVRAEVALHARDGEPDGFRWIVPDDVEQSVIAWLRFGAAGDPPIAVICNFTPVPRFDYRIGLPHAGRWREILNSDACEYGGSGVGNLGVVMASNAASHGYVASAQPVVPPLACLYLRYDP
jgi:1,4-alpha-glucan branching enzyme